MWRRIISNRDPRDTIYSEVRKEFSAYFMKGNAVVKLVVGLYPKFFFGTMIFLMLVSMVFSFTIFRHPEPAVKAVVASGVNPVTDGFTQISEASGKIRETLRLKHLVDSITAKKALSRTDSVFLDSALNRLQRNPQINK